VCAPLRASRACFPCVCQRLTHLAPYTCWRAPSKPQDLGPLRTAGLCVDRRLRCARVFHTQQALPSLAQLLPAFFGRQALALVQPLWLSLLSLCGVVRSKVENDLIPFFCLAAPMRVCRCHTDRVVLLGFSPVTDITGFING
jgi:hypothetical protein